MRKGSMADASEMNVKSSNKRNPMDRGAGPCEVDTVLCSSWGHIQAFRQSEFRTCLPLLPGNGRAQPQAQERFRWIPAGGGLIEHDVQQLTVHSYGVFEIGRAHV